LRWKKAAQEIPAAPPPVPSPAAPSPVLADGKERLTANEWAKRHQVNEVLAERAAMYAGKWHEPITEEEFLAFMGNKSI